MKTYLGLDVGTENIGYALAKRDVEKDDFTNNSTKSYEVMSVYGKPTIGVLSFKSAKTAVVRRTYRATRRRLDRRRYRIALLQEIFNDAIMAKDVNFLRRLSENDLHNEDRSEDVKHSGKFSLFNDFDFDDIGYYKKYPTIYHLRNELMVAGTNDIRLLYLAIHHIVKYRGHFLLSGDIYSEVGGVYQLKELIIDLNEKLKQNNEANEDFIFSEFKLDYLNDIKDLASGTGEVTQKVLDSITTGKKYLSKKDKKNKLLELFEVKKNVSSKIIDAFLGNKVNISDLFGSNCYSKDDVKGFYMSDDWDNIEDLQLIKNDRLHFDIIDIIKKIFDWFKINEMLKGKESLSSAMVNLYDIHKSDLKDLKLFIKDYAKDKYNEVFNVKLNEKGVVDETVNNYTCYIGGGWFDGEKVGANGRFGSTCSQEDFYKYIKKIIEETKSSNDENFDILKESLLDRIENKEFLPKIVSKNNSTIPYQLNMIEINKILEIAKMNPDFQFLNEVSDGKTNADKIKLLLSFRLPYYVGPVKEYKKKSDNKFAWAVRKESGRITPWNIENKIDFSSSNEQFIKRMTNKCTYLKIADTLPKSSILFSKFCCLNELNTLKINGEAISSDLKKEIFDKVYLKKNPSIKKIKKYLIDSGKYNKNLLISGIDNDIKSNMNTYVLYREKLGDKVDTDLAMVERIILLSTIHNDSKMLEQSIKAEFGDRLTDDELKAIKGYKFNGWGSLSAEFLAGYKNNGIKLMFKGEMLDIIDIMHEYNYNLQQILYHKECNYQEALNEYNLRNQMLTDGKTDFEEELVEYPCSPSVKKCFLQTFKLVKDIVKQTKNVPDVVFIESCRENTDKKKGQRTQKRKDMLEALYEEAKKSIKEFKKEEFSKTELNELVDNINDCKKKLESCTDNQLKKENLYLYFMQLGKDMYTGKPIDLSQVLTGNMYDHDHIIPRAMIKDDSFTNLVLVAKRENAIKSSEYPLKSEFRQDALWKKLNKIGLISNEKYARLIRKTPITPEEQDKFINRQLVETSQTVILLKNLFDKYFKEVHNKEVEIVLSKAGNVSMFRKEFNLTKSREVNDFHHAWDAYLNIVVGDILNNKFNHNLNIRTDNGKDKSYNFLNVLKEQATANNYEILKGIKKVMDSTDFQMVKLPRISKGAFYSEVLKTAEIDKNSKLIPMCDSKVVDGIQLNPKCDITKYGGYKTANTAYFVVVDSEDKKGNLMRNIVAISIFDDARIKNNKLTYEEIFTRLGFKNGRLANIEGMKMPIIKVGSLLDFGVYCLRLAGMTGKRLIFHNANQLFVSKDQNRYIKELGILVDKVVKESKKDTKEEKKEAMALEIIEESIRRKNNPDNKNSNIIVVNREDNLKLYDFFVYKLSHNPYKDIPTYSSLLDILQRGKEDFEQKKIYAQILLLLNIIKAFQCNDQAVDVSALSYVNKKGIATKGGTKQCSIVINSDITEIDKLILINQSMSGLKEQRIQLNLKKVDK